MIDSAMTDEPQHSIGEIFKRFAKIAELVIFAIGCRKIKSSCFPKKSDTEFGRSSIFN